MILDYNWRVKHNKMYRNYRNLLFTSKNVYMKSVLAESIENRGREDYSSCCFQFSKWLVPMFELNRCCVISCSSSSHGVFVDVSKD